MRKGRVPMNLNECRNKHDMTQGDVASYLNISLNTYLRYEYGGGIPKENREKLLKIFPELKFREER